MIPRETANEVRSLLEDVGITLWLKSPGENSPSSGLMPVQHGLTRLKY
jgi:hypothetical protein